MKVVLVFAALLVAHATAHMCLFYPHQRGSASGVDKAGATDCILLDKQCGGRKPDGSPLQKFAAGKNASIIFQKNLDHWNRATPGYFEVAWAKYDATTDFMSLLKVPDTGTPSLTVYNPNVTMPRMSVDHAVLQVTYVTNNTQAPAVFYQCADITIV